MKLEKLEVGQYVRVIEENPVFGLGDSYVEGDILLVTEVYDSHSICTNLRTGGKNCKVWVGEVVLMERMYVRMKDSYVGSHVGSHVVAGQVLLVYREVIGTGLWLAPRRGSYRALGLFGRDYDVVPVGVPVGAEIAFADVLVGDRIRRTRVKSSGTEVVVTGVVDRKTENGAYTLDTEILARAKPSSTLVSDVSVLLGRASEFVSAGVGSVAATATDLFVKEGVDSWRMYSKAGTHTSVGYSDRELEEDYVGCKVTYKV